MNRILGVMIDCSRNAVMNVETVKKFVDLIKKIGYNTLMLYTEDTYEVDGQPFFGHLRGRYSKEEIREIDLYCNDKGIELIPCIQTLAHLDNLLKWRTEYFDITDCDDILLIDDEKTYKLIDDMLKTISQCFSSKKIHIGMDEAYRVGTGKYQSLHGIKDRFDIINGHLHKVCNLVEKYNMEPMIWNDMFCKLALNIDNQFQHVDASKIIEKAKLPENVTLVYWDYYSTDYNHYDTMLKTNKMFGKKVIFAGGGWTWRGFAPDNDYSLKITDAALSACADNDIKDIFITLWGDDGAECSKFAILPSLVFSAELANGNRNIDKIKQKFKDVVGCEFDDFMLFDKLDIATEKHDRGASKYIFYNDLFMGIRDFKCSESDRKYYKNLADKFSLVKEKGEYAYLFDMYEKFARVLEIKCSLGIRTRKAYLDKNIYELKNISNDYIELLARVEDFYKSHKTTWFRENKPHGFDVSDIRIGGLIQRIKSCNDRIIEFTSGKIDCIPELEEPVLSEKNGYDIWSKIVTPNTL